MYIHWLAMARKFIALPKLFACKGEVDAGACENCSRLLFCSFRFCSFGKIWRDFRMNEISRKNYQITVIYPLRRRGVWLGLTSVLTSSTDLKSLDIDASLDWKGNRKLRMHVQLENKSSLKEIYCSNRNLTWRETTTVLEWIWRCLPFWLCLERTSSCSCAICLLRLFMS